MILNYLKFWWNFLQHDIKSANIHINIKKKSDFVHEKD